MNVKLLLLVFCIASASGTQDFQEEGRGLAEYVEDVSFYQAVFHSKKEAEEFIELVKAKSGDFEGALIESKKNDPEFRGGKVENIKITDLPLSLKIAIGSAEDGVLIDKPLEEKLGKQPVFFVVKTVSHMNVRYYYPYKLGESAQRSVLGATN